MYLGYPPVLGIGDPFNWRSKMKSVKHNVKKSISNLFGAASAIIEVSSELVVDATELSVTAVRQVRPVTKEILQSPMSAGEGYLIEQGVSPEEAHQRAFAVLDKDLASAVRAGAVGSGAALAALPEGWDDEEEAK